MVASIGALSAKKVDYYLARYYLELDDGKLRGPSEDARGVERKSLSAWLGSEAADHFGLSGAVKPRDFREVLDGYRHGQPLVQNAGKENRQLGWDITLTMAKSESLLAAFGSAAVQREVLAAHNAGVLAVHWEIQKLARTRVGKGGYDVEQASIPVAAFTHFDSREHDPNFHTHLVIPNLGLRIGGTSAIPETGTVLSKPFYQWKMALGQIYRSTKALEMERRLGVELEIDKRTGLYELKGIDKRFLEGFSTRREQITQALGSNSYSAKAADAASLATRRSKGHLSNDALSLHWDERAKELGFKSSDLEKALYRKRARDPSEARSARIIDAAITRAIERITEGRSHFSTRELVRDVLALTLGSPAESVGA